MQKSKLGRGEFDLGHWPRDRRGTEISVFFFCWLSDWGKVKEELISFERLDDDKIAGKKTKR